MYFVQKLGNTIIQPVYASLEPILSFVAPCYLLLFSPFLFYPFLGLKFTEYRTPEISGPEFVGPTREFKRGLLKSGGAGGADFIMPKNRHASA